MGRSVSTPLQAEHVFYIDWYPDLDEENEQRIADGLDPIPEDDPDYWQDEWEYIIYDLRNHVLFDLFPSVEEADSWLDNEDHVIAENGLVQFGISEYCGLASIWAVVKEYDRYWIGDPNTEGLASHWLDQAWPKIEAMFPNRLSMMGRFSNGEAVYKKVEASTP
jgi:hypothetical protein